MSSPTLFDGDTYDADLDGQRLGAQLRAVERLLSSGDWYSLAALAELTGYPQASISARIRDLRKPRHGSRIIDRRRGLPTGRPGTFEYRMDPDKRAEPPTPDPSLGHAVVVRADERGIVLDCQHCPWDHAVGVIPTVQDLTDALARHP